MLAPNILLYRHCHPSVYVYILYAGFQALHGYRGKHKKTTWWYWWLCDNDDGKQTDSTPRSKCDFFSTPHGQKMRSAGSHSGSRRYHFKNIAQNITCALYIPIPTRLTQHKRCFANLTCSHKNSNTQCVQMDITRLAGISLYARARSHQRFPCAHTRWIHHTIYRVECGMEFILLVLFLSCAKCMAVSMRSNSG